MEQYLVMYECGGEYDAEYQMYSRVLMSMEEVEQVVAELRACCQVYRLQDGLVEFVDFL